MLLKKIMLLLAIIFILPFALCAPIFTSFFNAQGFTSIYNLPVAFKELSNMMSKLDFKKLFIDDPEAKQSPIALNAFKQRATQLSKNNYLRLEYYNQMLQGELINNGVYVEFLPEKKTAQDKLPKISGGMLPKNKYQYAQHHIHWGPTDQKGSEHYLNGRQYDGELHIVHEAMDGSDQNAVLAVFLEAGSDGRAFKEEAEKTPLITEFEYSTHITIEGLAKKVPQAATSFFRYKGSLTTPRLDKLTKKLFCPEIVDWIVLTQPVEITQEQLNLLRKIKDIEGKEIVKNARELQRTNARRPILYSQAAPII